MAPPSPTPTPKVELTQISKEIIVEAKKASQFELLVKGNSLIKKNLEAGKFYLFKQKAPFVIKNSDSSSLQIIVNGKILHRPTNQSGMAIKYEIIE